jgi:hypothetical protein
VGRERSSFAGVKTSRTSCFSVSWTSQALRKLFFWVTIMFTRFGESRGVRDALLLGTQHWLWLSSRSSPVARRHEFHSIQLPLVCEGIAECSQQRQFSSALLQARTRIGTSLPSNSRPSIKVDRFSKSGVKLSFQCLHLVPQLLHAPL